MPNSPTPVNHARRKLLGQSLVGLGVAALLATPFARGLFLSKAFASTAFEVNYTDAEWKKRLTADQYRILREHGTERPFTSPLLTEHRPGTFTCAGCALPLFSSTTKFESGTGWPSFYQPLAGALNNVSDTTFGMARTEVNCHRCGGHQGHVFNDGPKPTGKRYCINGVALVFKAA